ncbi:hypothetical protein AB0F13_25745 [Streptomyces sp. NPDC026206]|uniref:hypothetical protein n=1 Tax=Streptomyces sp. NPDC026206 TaxID=3157089 RepID=UPI003409CED7
MTLVGLGTDVIRVDRGRGIARRWNESGSCSPSGAITWSTVLIVYRASRDGVAAAATGSEPALEADRIRRTTSAYVRPPDLNRT